jgi:ketosteroid isomerase-like protein
MVTRNCLGCLVLLVVLPLPVVAQEESGNAAKDAAVADEAEAIHSELRAMRVALTKAIESGDANAQVAYAHDNIVVTWQNHDVVRGTNDLKEFLDEMNSGGERVFQGYTEPPTADELTILHGGDTGIAFGKSVPHYKYLGMEFDLENRWTATLVRDGDQWKLAAYHVSGNILDNPLLSLAKRGAWYGGGLGLLAGLVVGALVTTIWRRRGMAAAR